jgi:hypothetical protein
MSGVRLTGNFIAAMPPPPLPPAPAAPALPAPAQPGWRFTLARLLAKWHAHSYNEPTEFIFRPRIIPLLRLRGSSGSAFLPNARLPPLAPPRENPAAGCNGRNPIPNRPRASRHLIRGLHSDIRMTQLLAQPR